MNTQIGYGIKKKNSLLNFLNKYRRRTGQFNVVEFGDVVHRGAYKIPDNKYNQFLKLYSKEMGKRELNFIESSKHTGPLIIDIDWGFKTKKRHYKFKDIRKLIKIINGVLRKYYRVNGNLKAFVLEKPHPTKKKEGKYKDGVHIIYPFMALTIPARYLIIHETKEQIQKQNLFKTIPHSNSIHDVFDMIIVENVGFIMFGSKKHMGQDYNLSWVFNSDLSLDNKKKYPKKILPALFSNRKFSDKDRTKLKNNIDFKKYVNKLQRMFILYNTVRQKLIGGPLKQMKTEDIMELVNKIRKHIKEKEKKKKGKSKYKKEFIDYEINNMNMSLAELFNELEHREGFFDY